jgi:hypothetical protein
VDLRFWKTDTIPTKVGVSLSLPQWEVLCSVTQVVDDLIGRVKDREPVDWRYDPGEDVYVTDFGRNRIGFPKSQIHSLTAIPFCEFCVSSTSYGYFDRNVQCLDLVFGDRIDSIDTQSSFYEKQRQESRDSHFIRHVT